MRKVTRRMVLFAAFCALGFLVIPAACAKEGTVAGHARLNAGTARAAHVSYVRQAKRGYRVTRASRRLIRSRGQPLAYRRGTSPRYPVGDWADLTLQCLLSQPFLICP